MRGLPFVSVIIAVYNDEKGILDTLASLSRQDYPGDKWEVIVVDNNSVTIHSRMPSPLKTRSLV